jgi:two-component system alkaline phosphatase synthesis response regulator PhoP
MDNRQGTRAARANGSQMDEADSPNGKTVLICDNERTLRALVRAALKDSGYRILEAQDGDEALEIARAQRPDLMILDMMMPGRTGLDVLAELRQTDELGATPVIMLTARTQDADREQAERAGADRFLPKPFSPRRLASIVDEMLDSVAG